MTILLCLVSITVVIVAFVIIATPINAREICKKTALYPLTFPPGKAEHMILCHPVGKALTAANNANLQFNAGVVAGQKAPEDMKCPSSNKDFCQGWNSTRITIPRNTTDGGSVLTIPVNFKLSNTLAALNNIQFNAGEEAAQNNINIKCPAGHTKDFCQGWDSVKIKTLNDVGRCVGSSHVNYCRLVLAFYSLTPILLFYGG